MIFFMTYLLSLSPGLLFQIISKLQLETHASCNRLYHEMSGTLMSASASCQSFMDGTLNIRQMFFFISSLQRFVFVRYPKYLVVISGV